MLLAFRRYRRWEIGWADAQELRCLAALEVAGENSAAYLQDVSRGQVLPAGATPN